jgi:hypothetical protein
MFLGPPRQFNPKHNTSTFIVRKDVVSVLQSQQQAINLMMDSLGLNKPKENPDGK